jgi:hypothetical protein
MADTQTHAETTKLIAILEDAYWRLKDLDTQDLAEEGDVLGDGLDDKVEEIISGIISGLDEFFA